MIAAGLRERGADEDLVRITAGLVHVHEDGGWPEADLVQAADSLSFLETMVPAVLAWVEEGRAPRERAEGKLRHCVERINPGLPRARRLAEAMLAPALSRLRAANDPGEVRDGAARSCARGACTGSRATASRACRCGPATRPSRSSPTARRRASARPATSRGGRPTTPAWAS